MIREEGEAATLEVGVRHPSGLVRLLGRMEVPVPVMDRMH